MNKKRSRLAVKATFLEPLLGTVPKDQDVYTAYLASKHPTGAAQSDELASVENIDEGEKGWTSFHSDENGDFLYDYQIKGFLKEAATVLAKELGVKQPASKIERYCYVHPRKVRLQGERGEPLERALRAMTPQGPRNTLVRSDLYLEGTVIEFTVTVIPNTPPKGQNAVTVELVQELLAFGELKGLGQWRNGGYGRFTAEVTLA